MSPIFDTVCVLPLSGLLFWSSVPPIFGDEYCTAIGFVDEYGCSTIGVVQQDFQKDLPEGCNDIDIGGQSCY